MSGDKPPRPGSRSPTGRQVLRERPERALDIAEAVCDPIPVRQGRAAMGLKIREEPRSLPEEETGIALAHHGGERGEGALRKEAIVPQGTGISGSEGIAGGPTDTWRLRLLSRLRGVWPSESTYVTNAPARTSVTCPVGAKLALNRYTCDPTGISSTFHWSPSFVT